MGDSYRVAAAVSASVPASNLDAALCVLRSLQLLLLLQMLLFDSTKLDKVTFSNYSLVFRSFLIVGNTSVLL